MSDNELLLAIADIVGRNTKALESRIDRVETYLNNKIDEVEASLNNKIDEVDKRLSNKIDEVDKRLSNKIDEVDKRLSSKIDEVDKRLSNKIDGVDGRVNNIMLRLENVIEPRLNNIESCYISTYDKYRDETEKIETIEMNVAVLQSVVKEYGVKLNTISA